MSPSPFPSAGASPGSRVARLTNRDALQHFVQGGYFLKDIALFDSAFYNYTTDVANVSIP